MDNRTRNALVAGLAKLKLLGDPHLGKRFVNGVPLARQGERERMVWDQFVAELDPGEAEIHVCMGDLFDRPHVPYDLILKTARAYVDIAYTHADVDFFILKGNHDWQRDLEKAAAFDLFAALVEGVDNIHVVTTSLLLKGFGFFAWHPTRIAEEMWIEGMGQTVLGHWDVESFGGASDNVIPFDFFKEKGVRTVITGHVHQIAAFERKGLNILQTGSMQPYAHGEESDEDLYLTRTLAEFDPDLDYSDKCLRIVLAPGEVFDHQVECLQLTLKRAGAAEAEEAPQVELGEFDIEKLFAQAFAEVGVDEAFLGKTLSQFHERRAVG